MRFLTEFLNFGKNLGNCQNFERQLLPLQSSLPLFSITHFSNFPFQKVIKVHMRSVGCDQMNLAQLTNYSCFLKPTRDGGGRATFLVSGFKPTTDLWITMRFYYRNTALRWLPFSQAFHYDVCQLAANLAHADVFTTMIYQTLNMLAPNLLHRCPYKGTFGVRGISMAELFSNSIPNIIPRGTYKSSWRFYGKKQNITYMHMWGIGEVAAINVLENISI